MKKILYIFLFFQSYLFLQTEMVSVYDSLSGNMIETPVKTIITRDSLNDYIELDKKDMIIVATPTNVKPVSSIKINKENNYFNYLYSIHNSADKWPRIMTFMIEYRAELFGTTIPNNDWRHTQRFQKKNIVRWRYTKVEMQGEWGLPPGIKAGDTVSGFVLQSEGLPTILNSYFNSWRSSGFVGDPLTGKDDSLYRLINTFPNNYKIVKNIGPADPPSPFIPAAFADTLVSFTIRSFELGWIKTENIKEQLEHKIGRIKKKINIGQVTKEVNALKELDSIIKKQKDKKLTSEAYALLKYNAGYLKNQLNTSGY